MSDVKALALDGLHLPDTNAMRLKKMLSCGTAKALVPRRFKEEAKRRRDEDSQRPLPARSVSIVVLSTGRESERL